MAKIEMGIAMMRKKKEKYSNGRGRSARDGGWVKAVGVKSICEGAGAMEFLLILLTVSLCFLGCGTATAFPEKT